jgi:hypothetical protein
MTSSGANAVVDAQAADLRRVRVRVNLSERELGMVDRNRSAHVRPLTSDDDEDADDLDAEPDDADDIEDVEDVEETPRAAGSAQLFYSVNNANAACLRATQMVELFLAGGGAEHKIVPLAALLYGAW